MELPSSELPYFFGRWASSNFLHGGKVEKEHGVGGSEIGRVCNSDTYFSFSSTCLPFIKVAPFW